MYALKTASNPLMKLRRLTRATELCLCVVLTISWLISSCSPNQIENVAQNEKIALRVAIAQKIADETSRYFENMMSLLGVIAHLPGFGTMTATQQTQILGNVYNHYPMFDRLAVVNLNSKERTAITRMGRFPTEDISKERTEAIRSTQSIGQYIGPVQFAADGHPEISLAVPIESVPGHPTAVLLGHLNLMDLSSLLKDVSIGKQGYAYIVDMRKRQLIAHPNLTVLLNATPSPETEIIHMTSADAPSGVIEFKDTSNQKVHTAVYSTVPRLNWRVFFQETANPK